MYIHIYYIYIYICICVYIYIYIYICIYVYIYSEVMKTIMKNNEGSLKILKNIKQTSNLWLQ